MTGAVTTSRLKIRL